MANAFKANVWVVDTTAAHANTGPFTIRGVKLKAGSNAAAVTIKVDGASGTTVHEINLASGELFERVFIRGTNLAVSISGTGALAYIYLD